MEAKRRDDAIASCFGIALWVIFQKSRPSNSRSQAALASFAVFRTAFFVTVYPLEF